MPISLRDKIHSNACFLRGRFEDSDLELVDSAAGCSYTDRALDTTSRSVDCTELNHKHSIESKSFALGSAIHD
jgi:hypothetical protein